MWILKRVFDIFNLILFVNVELFKGIISFFAPSVFIKEKELRGKTVLLTGAAGGLGRNLAYRLAERGCNLILWDRDEKGLKETKNECESHGVEVKTEVVDLSNSSDIAQAANEIGSIDILINNAGVGQEGAMIKVTEEEIRRTMEINFSEIDSSRDGRKERRVTIASGSAFSPLAYAVPYSVSKSTALAIQDALENELSAMGKDGVKFTTILPGFFISPLTEKFINDRGIKPTITAEDVAEETVNAIIYERSIAIIPKMATILFALKNVLPRSIVQRIFFGK